MRIDGPYDAGGADDTPSRRAVFVCEPATADQERPCAERIATAVARRAYRGLQSSEDIETLMRFYEAGRDAGGFDTGIEMVLQRVLADPKFIYRIEAEPVDVAPGETYRISDLELASRLSFFLWSSIPDDELLTLAEQGRLKSPDVLEQQVARMLDDPRSAALSANFAGQWLNLRALDGHVPVVDLFPDFDDNLREALRRETELFFDSLIRENRSAMELLTADYTFVNERLAKHYGIPGIKGSRFRRVELGEEFEARRGVLGKGALLTVWSQPVRTSPVIRGYRVLQDLLGVPPPPPPDDVPDLEPVEADATGNASQPSMREQMQRHQADPVCSACHVLMDPIGFALEPFDAVGGWRTEDGGEPINTSVVMYDGTPVDGPADLREFLLEHSDRFLRNATEKLLTYALGRGVEYYDMPFVREITRAAERDDYRMRALITAVVLSDAFQMNGKVERAVPETAGSSASAATVDQGG
jgi:hypothetical protein